MRWHRTPDGCYLSHDGVYLISKEWGLTFCDNPHPQKSGYCWGGEEHDYTFWMISKLNERGHFREHEKHDAYNTLRQAKHAVEQEVERADMHREGLRSVR